MLKSLETQITEKLRADGASEGLISAFLSQVRQVAAGESGLISEADIGPIEGLPNSEEFCADSGEALANLGKIAVIKLNGGLGTSMGLDKAKSLLPAKDNKSFLEIIVNQLISFRKNYSKQIPLILMNSFRTEADCIEFLNNLDSFDPKQDGIDVSFIQNRVPKLCAETLQPLSLPNKSASEWCPPGHGDLYTALHQSGLLNRLIEKGIKYAFVSNADNLGATLDLAIFGYFIQSKSPFLMEVADRTTADKKGGHLSQNLSTGRLLLREVAQCPPEEIQSFQDIQRFRYFNTNSIWLDLVALQGKLDKNKGYLNLPLIANQKFIKVGNAETKVIQLETAMGAAIGEFEGSSAVRVSRRRFLPIKRTSDLLRLWSDRFTSDNSGRVVPTQCGTNKVNINLDEKYFSKIKDFQSRFSKGVPSLKDCSSLTIKGDVNFGSGVVCKGDVLIENTHSSQLQIENSSILQK